tara:strand:- start:1207 stop:1563 length:357 start_codon:yes stop_codon:yes gene_type:complete
MKFLALILSLFITYYPSPSFICDGDILHASIRNNLNGDFAITEDLENIDKGAFVVLSWRDLNIMLPVSFNVGEITFTDKRWLWSYQDKEAGLIAETPRFAHRLPNGKIQEFSCNSIPN